MANPFDLPTANPFNVTPSAGSSPVPTLRATTLPGVDIGKITENAGAKAVSKFEQLQKTGNAPSDTTLATTQTKAGGTVPLREPVTIKNPFNDSAISTLPDNFVSQQIKGLAEWPERVVRDIGDAFNALRGKPIEEQNGAYHVDTIAQTFKDINDSLIQNGASPAYAEWASTLGAAGAGILDFTPFSGVLEGGLTKLAKGGVPTTNEQLTAWNLLGRPKNDVELQGNFRNAIKLTHPDTGLGNEKLASSINQANAILKKTGLPDQSLSGKAATLAQKLIKPLTRDDLEQFARRIVGNDAPMQEGFQWAGARRQLPGTRIEGGRPRVAFGLSTERVERMGGATPEPSLPKTFDPLVTEAKKYSSPEDFVSSMEYKNWREDMSAKEFKAFTADVEKAVNDSHKGNIESFLTKVYDDAHAEVQAHAIPEEVTPKEVAPSGDKSLMEEAKKYGSAEEFVSNTNSSVQEKAASEYPSFKKYNYERTSLPIEDIKQREVVDTGSDKFKEIKKAVSRGDRTPIIVDESNFVLDGHHRLNAYKESGANYGQVPVLKVVGKGSGKIVKDEKLTDIYNRAHAAPTRPLDESIEAQFERRKQAMAMSKVNGLPIEQNTAQVIHELTKGPDGASWSSIIKGYSKNLPKDKKVHILDYAATPEFVLEKLGLQKGAEMLQDAKDVYRRNLKKEIKTVEDWKKEVEADGKPHSTIRIFRYLDGDARYAKGEMTDVELRVAKEIKSYLKDWARRLKLPEDSQISNYITHLFDKNATDVPLETVFEDPEMAEIMQNKSAKSVYNPFLEKRVNKQGYKEDVWAALDAYVKRGTRKEAMDPALEQLSKDAQYLDEDSYKYVAKLTHNINMRPDFIDRHIDSLVKEVMGNKLTDRPTANITKKIRNMFYRGMLGLNVSSALRNLSQGANTYAKLGEKYTVVGYTKLFTRLVTKNVQELYDEGVLDEAVNQDKKIGVYKSFLQKADPVLFSMFELAEKINRGAAYFGAKAKYWDKVSYKKDGASLVKPGASEEQARKYAKRIVRETQFAFGAVDSPVIMSGDTIKTLFQLQSYNLKQGEFLMRMAKNKEYIGLVRWAMASVAFVLTIGRLFGMKVEQLIPTVGLGSPLFSLLGGVSNLTSNSAKNRASGVNALQNLGWATIPAGVQARKTITGLEAYNKGRDTTATGKTRYTIPKTTGNLVRAALFGKNKLDQAQEYYQKQNNPSSKKKTTTVSRF